MKSPSKRGLPPAKQAGVALVITLILLAAIVVVVAAFLALTGRERASVRDSSSLKDAELAATTALERAKAHILYSLQNDSFLGPDLVVSRSYPNTPVLDLPTIATNLGTSLTRDARVPVFVDTNKAGTRGPAEFRYYLDINRNGWPETNGFWAVLDDTEAPVRDASGNIYSNFFTGDPEWIGVPENPSQRHGIRNRFQLRYAYVIVPAGRGVDFNFIHNQAKWPSVQPPQPGFFRNTVPPRTAELGPAGLGRFYPLGRRRHNRHAQHGARPKSLHRPVTACGTGAHPRGCRIRGRWRLQNGGGQPGPRPACRV